MPSVEDKLRLDQFSNLPSLPQIILKIREVSDDPKSSVADLANCILSDQQLTGRILRTANSSYYGEFSGKVNTVTQAIVLIGFRAVRHIAISMSVYGAINRLTRETSFDIASFWARSVGCGVIAKYLVQKAGRTELVEPAFIAGLLHDVGQVMLAGSFPKEYEKISSEHLADPDIYETEQAILGLDHQEAGGYIARRWGLPDDLVDAMASHHRKGMSEDVKSRQLLTDLVYLGDTIYAFMMTGEPATSRTYTAISRQAQQLVGAPPKAMAGLLETCREQIAEIARDLDIDIETEFDRKAVPVDITDVQRDETRKELQLACLQNASSALALAEDEDSVLAVMCETAFIGLQLGRVILLEYERASESFVGRQAFGLAAPQKVTELVFPVTESGLLEFMLREVKPFSALSRDSNLYGPVVAAPELDQLEAAAFAAVPIAVGSEARFVIFIDMSDRQAPINDETMGSIVSLANQASMVLERNYYRSLIPQ